MSNVEPASFLPLKPQVFEVLLSLADGARHGYAIMHEVEERTGGRVHLLPGTLYRFLHRLVEEGLLIELPAEETDSAADRQRRTYALTGLGDAVVRAESERLQETLAVARAKQLLRKGV